MCMNLSMFINLIIILFNIIKIQNEILKIRVKLLLHPIVCVHTHKCAANIVEKYAVSCLATGSSFLMGHLSSVLVLVFYMFGL